jgi:hypothetical protein
MDLANTVATGNRKQFADQPRTDALPLPGVSHSYSDFSLVTVVGSCEPPFGNQAASLAPVLFEHQRHMGHPIDTAQRAREPRGELREAGEEAALPRAWRELAYELLQQTLVVAADRPQRTQMCDGGVHWGYSRDFSRKRP